MISQTAEYALRAMVCLADHVHQPLTSHQLAEQTRVPVGYLAKIMKQLGRAGLVLAQRGPNGGFKLAHEPTELTILAVVNAVDPVQRIRHCPLGLEAHATNLCPLHRRLDAALASVEQAFSATTLAELVGEPNGPHPLCEAKPAKITASQRKNGARS